MSKGPSLSPAAVAELESSMGPKGKKGGVDSQSFRAARKIAKAGIAFGTAPASVAWSMFGSGSHADRSAKAVAALKRTVSKSPEVMVKVTGRQNGRGHVASNFAYIARLGWGDDKELELLTSEGKVLTDWRDMSDLAQKWQDWEMADETRRKGATSLSFVLSMPPGSDPEKVKAAALGFAQTEMEGRRWVMGLHTDRDHPHVHLTIARRDLDGRRFHPGKEDLFRYRQTFAEKLRGQGIEANATPRKARGQTKKAGKTPIVQIQKRGETSKHLTRVRNETLQAVRSGELHDPFDGRIREQQKDVFDGFKTAARELAAGDASDRQLAKEIVEHLRSMPKIETRAAENYRTVREGIDRQQQGPENRSGADRQGEPHRSNSSSPANKPESDRDR